MSIFNDFDIILSNKIKESDSSPLLSVTKIDEFGKKYTLNDIVMEYINDDNAYIRFVDENKFGINPSTNYATPIGLCAYPIKQTFRIYKSKSNKIDYYKEKNSINDRRILRKLQFINRIPMFNRRKYAQIFRCKNPESILVLSDLNVESALDLVKKFISIHENDEEFYNEMNKNLKIKNKHNAKRGVAKIWLAIHRTLVYYAERENLDVSAQFTKDLKTLGYSGILDNGKGIIHPAEKCQLIIFNTRDCELIETYENNLANHTDD